ncbi:MAG: type 1 pili tip component [Pseudomonadota bacterium]
MSFKALLERWRDTPATVTTESTYAIRLDVDDAARVEALAALFPGIDAETVIADLLHAALDAAEAAMPYEAGERVIAEDEFGDPVFEDVGLTPRYVELVRARRDDLN